MTEEMALNGAGKGAIPSCAVAPESPSSAFVSGCGDALGADFGSVSSLAGVAAFCGGAAAAAVERVFDAIAKEDEGIKDARTEKKRVLSNAARFAAHSFSSSRRRDQEIIRSARRKCSRRRIPEVGWKWSAAGMTNANRCERSKVE
jgi:hypothetical protein